MSSSARKQEQEDKNTPNPDEYEMPEEDQEVQNIDYIEESKEGDHLGQQMMQ